MEKFDLDVVFVPAGLLVMASYHIWFFYQLRHNPSRIVVGMSAINRRLWVTSMMQDTHNGTLAVQTLRNNIMASTLLGSTSIMLSTLIVALVAGGHTGHGGIAASGNISDHCRIGLTYDEGTKLRLTTKFFSIFVSFLVSFLMNIQSIRYFSHANMLINVPYKKITNFTDDHLTVEYVSSMINLGSYFWSLGLRAFYFSFPLFLWLFGALPMFISSIFLVFMLYLLDLTLDIGSEADAATTDEETG